MSDAGRGVIVGRSDEIGLVRRLVDDGDHGVLVLDGEAGIGKTALLEVASHRARRAGMTVLSATAEELYSSRPLAVLAEALGRVDATPHDEAALLAMAAEQWRPTTGPAVDAIPALVDRALDVLEALTLDRPALVVLDDLQWADPASLLVLGPLVRRAVPLGARFVLAMRPLPRGPALADLVARLAEHGAVLRRVAPLTESDVVQLTRLLVDGQADPALLDRMRHAGGNPFLVRELARAGTEPGPLPDGLIDLVARRLRVAGDRASETLRAGAVVGSVLRPDDLAAIVGHPLGEVSETLTLAVTAGLLVETGNGLSFQHDLVRDALVQQTPDAVRRALHRRAAAVLRERGAAPEVVAGHLVAGAEQGDREVIAALRDAARGGAPVITADLLRTALERCDATDPQRPALALEAADALLFAGRPAEAVAVAAEALDAEPPPAIAYELRACRSHALFTLGDPSAAITTWLDDAPPATAGRHPHHLERAEVALARLFNGDTAGARQDATAALADGDAATPLACATAHAVLAWLDASAADMPAALAHVEASAAVAGDHRWAGAAPYGGDLMRAAVADAAGLDDLVASSLQAARRQVADHGLGVLEPMLYAVQAIHDLRVGDWDDALAACDAGTSAMTDSGIRLAANWLAAVRAIVLVDRDDPDGAAAALDRSTEPGVVLGQDWVVLARARALAAAGDPHAACELLGAVVELLVGVGARSCLAYAGPDLARLIVTTGDTDRARWLGEAIEDLPAPPPPPMAAALASVAAVLDDDPGAALAAAADLLACDRRAEAARTMAWAAGRLATRDPDAARDAARQASALFDAMGAVAPAGALRAQLRDAGVRFRTPTTATATIGWESLTPTERRVVALVADGLTNGAIAERLTVSRRTVESHLVRVYRKVGVGSRVELARLADAGAAEPAAAQPPA